MLPSRTCPFIPQMGAMPGSGIVAMGWVLAQRFSKLSQVPYRQKVMQGKHETRQGSSEEDWGLPLCKAVRTEQKLRRNCDSVEVQAHQAVSSTGVGNFCLFCRHSISICGLNDWNENNKKGGR